MYRRDFNDWIKLDVYFYALMLRRAIFGQMGHLSDRND